MGENKSTHNIVVANRPGFVSGVESRQQQKEIWATCTSWHGHTLNATSKNHPKRQAKSCLHNYWGEGREEREKKRKEEMIQTGCCISGHKVGSVSHSIRHAHLSSRERNRLCESIGSTSQSYLVQCVFKGCRERSRNEILNGGARLVRWIS